MSDEDAVRARIVAIARENIGAHYLSGMFGAIPGGTDPIATERRLDWINADLEWPTLAVYAATTTYRGKILRCCGRYQTPQRIVLSAPARTIPGTDLGRWVQSARAAPEYQAQPLSSAPRMFTHRTAPFQGQYYPRRHCLVPGGATQDPTKIYLGESCAGKRHFDCIGFVCYVLRESVNRLMRYNLPESGCGNWLQHGSSDCGTNVAMCAPGDLVLSATHVAIVSAVGSRLRLIHANGDMPGVEETGFDRARGNTWTRNFHAIHFSRAFLGV